MIIVADGCKVEKSTSISNVKKITKTDPQAKTKQNLCNGINGFFFFCLCRWSNANIVLACVGTIS